MIKYLLVVCIGNICRSPMAEELLRQALPGRTIFSAGIGALVGKPAEPNAIELMAESGLDISQHRAQQFTTVMAGHADLILVMDSKQKHEIQRMHPSASGKIFRLGELDKFDIPDPYCQPRHAFEQALQLIQRGVDIWAPRVRALD
ncbi:low molecular weight protein-tyrosine-phosphatase [Cupriavidus basilensis]|uniref:low molecular weight protein-tyrosine-phosphatase n=1 Tax=Cupriavidus basilensis TaxID=68895 RepID=UPI00157A720D|nr:low molecular weight protein-tyrosine-phosphatase [Cupriavidus basilensis]NUA29691.1 low molecular weight phosphotyrosine protein phosphatase [Cupriavidus basilensis]